VKNINGAPIVAVILEGSKFYKVKIKGQLALQMFR
jgi:hypothetical protein